MCAIINESECLMYVDCIERERKIERGIVAVALIFNLIDVLVVERRYGMRDNERSQIFPLVEGESQSCGSCALRT